MHQVARAEQRSPVSKECRHVPQPRPALPNEGQPKSSLGELRSIAANTGYSQRHNKPSTLPPGMVAQFWTRKVAKGAMKGLSAAGRYLHVHKVHAVCSDAGVSMEVGDHHPSFVSCSHSSRRHLHRHAKQICDLSQTAN